MAEVPNAGSRVFCEMPSTVTQARMAAGSVTQWRPAGSFSVLLETASHLRIHDREKTRFSLGLVTPILQV